MNTRIINQFAKLPDFTRLDLLRMMIEGQLGFDTVLEVAATNKLADLRAHVATMADFSKMVHSFTMYYANAEAKKILDEFTQLPIADRIEQKEAYQVKLLRVSAKDDPIQEKFAHQCMQDVSVVYALEIFIGVYTQGMYSGSKNDLIIQTLKGLHPTNHDQNIQLNDFLSPFLTNFKFIYNILINSYMDRDKKHYIETVVGRIIQLELNFRAPLINCITFLTTLKGKVMHDEIKEAKFLLFGSKTPEGVIQLRPVLARLPDDLHSVGVKTASHVDEIKRCYAEVKDIVATEKKKTLGREKHIIDFYKDLAREIDDIDEKEGKVLGLKNVFAEKVKK